MTQDLYCSASGPGVNQTCNNTQIELTTNPQGVTIYKIDRTKTITGGENAGVFPDEAHVIPMTKSSQYSGVLMSVDQVNASNIQHLGDIIRMVTVTK